MPDTGYIYKPSAREVDELRKVVDGLREFGYDVGISRLYESLAKKAISDYRTDQNAFMDGMREYMRSGTSGRERVR